MRCSTPSIDETERLERLVTKTLDLSRIRAGGVEPELRVAEIGRPRDGGGPPAAPADPRPHDPPRGRRRAPAVCVDVGMIEEVFLDLLENALRFAPSGSEICVSAEPVGDFIEVRVADHGPGVPPDQRSASSRSSPASTPVPDATGTGLGLAIVRALDRRARRPRVVRGDPGGGATFGFAVPVVDAA